MRYILDSPKQLCCLVALVDLAHDTSLVDFRVTPIGVPGLTLQFVFTLLFTQNEVRRHVQGNIAHAGDPEPAKTQFRPIITFNC